MGEAITNHDITQLRESICKRLDGHGKNLESIWAAINEIREQQVELIKENAVMSKENTRGQMMLVEKLLEHVSTVKEKCSDRHNSAVVKIAGVSAFVSGIITGIGMFFKFRTGGQ